MNELTAFSTTLSESLRRMSAFYAFHPTPGLINPVDAWAGALSDMAAAVEHAACGEVFVKPGTWEAYAP